jgi:hypothetical protein
VWLGRLLTASPDAVVGMAERGVTPATRR